MRHTDKFVKCRFFVVPVSSPALLRIPYTELLSVIRVMCETRDSKTNDRKFDVQTRHAADSQNCSATRDLQTRLDADDVNKDKTNISSCLNSTTTKTNMSDYFHSSDNKEADKRVSETITAQYTMNLMIFSPV